MIIKQTRVKVGGAQKLVAHITNTAQNDAVMIIKGHLGIPQMAISSLKCTIAHMEIVT